MALRLAPVLALLTLGSCAHEPRCQGPTHAVTPVRDVPAPMVRLAGMRLDFNAEQARRACEDLQGTFHDGMYCEPQLADEKLRDGQPISPLRIALKFDRFGRVKEITAFYIVSDDALPELVKTIASPISAAIGEPGSGGLAYCTTAELCERARYEEWPFEGGQIRLESERRDEALELKLTHSHRDMTEQVQYGLPVCAP